MSIHRSFWPAFQKRWAAVLCEQTEGLGAWSENMTQALRHGILEVPNSVEAHAALAQLNVRLSRLESSRLDSDESRIDVMARALFIRYGTAILSSAPLSSAPLPTSDRGSEAANAISHDDLKLALDELSQWLIALKLVPRRIFALEDFNSQILGRVLAQQLSVDFALVKGDGFTHSKSLIVSADNRALLATPLRTVFPAQVLYSFNLHRGGGVIVPDVSSLSLSEPNWPWQDERLSARKITSHVERVLASPACASADEFEESQRRLEFYKTRREWLTAGNSCYARPFMLPEII